MTVVSALAKLIDPETVPLHRPNAQKVWPATIDVLSTALSKSTMMSVSTGASNLWAAGSTAITVRTPADAVLRLAPTTVAKQTARRLFPVPQITDAKILSSPIVP